MDGCNVMLSLTRHNLSMFNTSLRWCPCFTVGIANIFLGDWQLGGYYNLQRTAYESTEKIKDANIKNNIMIVFLHLLYHLAQEEILRECDK
jgi:hypothetical protein